MSTILDDINIEVITIVLISVMLIMFYCGFTINNNDSYWLNINNR